MSGAYGIHDNSLLCAKRSRYRRFPGNRNSLRSSKAAGTSRRTSSKRHFSTNYHRKNTKLSTGTRRTTTRNSDQENRRRRRTTHVVMELTKHGVLGNLSFSTTFQSLTTRGSLAPPVVRADSIRQAVHHPAEGGRSPDTTNKSLWNTSRI